jgi:hypothetical protein
MPVAADDEETDSPPASEPAVAAKVPKKVSAGKSKAITKKKKAAGSTTKRKTKAKLTGAAASKTKPGAKKTEKPPADAGVKDSAAADVGPEATATAQEPDASTEEPQITAVPEPSTVAIDTSGEVVVPEAAEIDPAKSSGQAESRKDQAPIAFLHGEPWMQEQAAKSTTEWQVLYREDRRPYFFSPVTGEVTWFKPTGVVVPALNDPLPLGWRELLTGEGVSYFLNLSERCTQWGRPL